MGITWMVYLLSQTELSPPGWWNYIIQGGSFGLLVYIVVYLGPKLLKDARDERDSREKLAREERDKHDLKFENIVTSLSKEFEVRNDKLVTAIGIQTDKLVTEMKRESDEMTLVLANTCNYELAQPKRPRPPSRPTSGEIK